MTALLRGLPIAGDAARIEISTRDHLTRDDSGSGWRAASVTVYGRHGAYRAGLSMTAGSLRELAASATRTAAHLDALRTDGTAAPFLCLCPHNDHFDQPEHYCPNVTQQPFGYCRSCWTPDTGMQWTHSDGAARLATRPAGTL